jgi:hypothetical protein
MDVELYVAELVPQLMPNICVKTGRPAVTTRRLKVQHVPTWAYFLLPLIVIGIGILVVIIVIEAVATKFTLTFPVCAEVAADRKRRIRLAWGFGAVGTGVLCVLAIAMRQPLVALLAALSLVVGLFFAQSTRSWVRAKLTADGRVILRNASPAWVAQQHALVQASRAAFHQQAFAAQQYGQQYAQLQALPQYAQPQAQPFAPHQSAHPQVPYYGQQPTGPRP